jgi:squalene-hopene/tetraprenyl-beta-curcumene cyclase
MAQRDTTIRHLMSLAIFSSSLWPCLLAAQTLEVAVVTATSDEPVAKTFSLESAAASLDSTAIDFSRKHHCIQCHANFMYLVARPVLASFVKEPPDVRQLCESIVRDRWAKEGPRYDGLEKTLYPHGTPDKIATEPIVIGFSLAVHDRSTTGKLHPLTQRALNYLLTLQRGDGGFNVVGDGSIHFLQEFDQTLLAAIAIAAAPEEYDRTTPAKESLDRIRQYVKSHPPANQYQKAMLLWASAEVADLINDADRQQTIEALFRIQHEDGGWTLAMLLPDDEAGTTGKYGRMRPSDGYGTGFTILALLKAGIAANETRIQRAISWLKSNQRASGRWFVESLAGRPANLISNSGTAFAVLALDACGEIGQAKP